MPCVIVFAEPEDIEMWPNLCFHFHLRFRFFFFFFFVCLFFFFFFLFVFFFFYHGQDFIIFSYSCFDLSAYLLFGFIRNIWKCANSKAWVLYSNSAVNIYDSKAYRNMAMTRERNDFTFDPKDIESPN